MENNCVLKQLLFASAATITHFTCVVRQLRHVKRVLETAPPCPYFSFFHMFGILHEYTCPPREKKLKKKKKIRVWVVFFPHVGCFGGEKKRNFFKTSSSHFVYKNHVNDVASIILLIFVFLTSNNYFFFSFWF